MAVPSGADSAAGLPGVDGAAGLSRGGSATLPSWVSPGEGKPAPGLLLLFQAFINTWDAEHGTDTLARAETAGPWLRETGLAAAGGDPSEAELRQAREVRESLRAVLARNGSDARPTAAELVPLEALAGASSLRLSVDPAGQILLAPGSGTLADGLAGLLLVVRDAQRQGTWQRLKICRNPDCRWAFYDRSHTRRGAWCDMATCGNMIKNRNFRARHKQ